MVSISVVKGRPKVHSLFTHPGVVLKPHDLLSFFKHKRRVYVFIICSACVCSYTVTLFPSFNKGCIGIIKQSHATHAQVSRRCALGLDRKQSEKINK